MRRAICGAFRCCMIGWAWKAAAAGDALTYWLALILALGTIAFIYGLLRSRQGLGLAAVRDNEQAARAVGVDALRMKAIVYITAAFLTGLVGALIYVQRARISPDAAFSVVDWTAYVIFIVVIGGIGTIEGPIVGVIVFSAAEPACRLRLLVSADPRPYRHRHHPFRATRALWGLFSDRTGIHLSRSAAS